MERKEPSSCSISHLLLELYLATWYRSDRPDCTPSHNPIQLKQQYFICIDAGIS